MKWFKHETDAHTNLKLQNVIDTFGLEAYGYYWMCVELVALQSENFHLNSEKNWKNYLKKLSGLLSEQQDLYLQLFAEINLIDKKSLIKGTLSIPKLAERCDEYTDKLRRKSRHTRDNVGLEEKRRDKKRREESKPENSISFLSEIPTQDLTDLSEKYKIDPSGIKSKAYDLKLYCEQKGKVYKNYKSFLENAVRSDKEKLQNKFPYTKIIASPPVLTLTPEQKARNAELVAGISLMVKSKKIAT